MYSTLLFAANANVHEGTGHLRRCIEFSKACRQAGYKTVLVGSCDVEWMKPLLYDAFNLVDPNFGTKGDSILILDSYVDFFLQQRRAAFPNARLLQIVDPNTPLVQAARIVWLDPFPPPLNIVGKIEGAGLPFYPLRNFDNGIRLVDKAKEVLITTGGIFQEKVFDQLIEVLQSLDIDGVDFHVIGSRRDYFGNRFHFHPLGQSLDLLARSCDTVITSAGGSVWDFLANGLAVGYYWFVTNQRSNFDYLVGNSFGVPLTDKEGFFSQRAISSLLFDLDVRKKAVYVDSSRFDFGGTQRFVTIISRLSG
jgi:spore coat polysaccharide biosynthesis predicted glycosyltransferase SpsG